MQTMICGIPNSEQKLTRWAKVVGLSERGTQQWLGVLIETAGQWKKKRRDEDKTYEKRQDVLPTEHVSRQLRPRQPPVAEQTQRVQAKFFAAAGDAVLDEELLPCSDGRSGA